MRGGGERNLRHRRHIVSLALRALVLVGTHALNAQVVRGVVADRGGVPVPGVVLQLLDSASVVAARALTNERGEFRLFAARPGTYRVRTLRIGFRPTVSAPVRLDGGAELTQSVALTGVSLALDTVRVGGKSACRVTADSAAATWAVWEQVRAALTAAQITAGARNISATTVLYERSLDPGGRRTLQQTSAVQTDFVTQPWLTLPPDSLRRIGYVVDDGIGVIYHAPGLDMLASGAFVEDHCFRLTGARDGRNIGVEFEPAPSRRRIPEVRGTLWLDRATSELRSAEIRFVNISAEQEQEAGAAMEFARMSNGSWAISRWSIRMPVVTQVVRAQALGGIQRQVAEIRVAGGELALAVRGADTLWSRAPLVLTGSVLDSLSGGPIAGATASLAGTRLAATTDARGRFSIMGVLPGEYIVEVRTASLDSLRAVHQVPFTFADSGSTVQLRVPSSLQLLATLCPSRGEAGAPIGVIVGRVTTRGDSVPKLAATVVAEWRERAAVPDPGAAPAGTSGVAAGTAPTRWLEVRSSARGTFRFCGVPSSGTISVRATTDSLASALLELTLPPGARYARADLILDRERGTAAVFTGAVVTDTASRPIVGAEVTFPELSRTAFTNTRGTFRIGDVPAGTHRVVVRRFGYGPLDTQLTFAPSSHVERRIVLGRVATLDSVRVTASARLPATFDEHRKLGLGHFVTRDDLAQQEGRRLSEALFTVPGLGVVTGRGPMGWVMSKRIPPTFGGSGNGSIYVPNNFEARQGMKAGCYAKVYLDNLLMNPQQPTEPFDINTIAPEQIEAIEFYAGPSQTPLKYSNLNSACGVLVIHRRRSP